MKSKKGFTLIELLAVIVILAVIALIATPLIMNVINDAKKNAAKDSAYGYVKAVENAMVSYMYEHTSANLANGSFNVKTNQFTPSTTGATAIDLTSFLNYSGTKADEGTLTVVNGVVNATTNLKIGGYTITIANGQVTDAQ